MINFKDYLLKTNNVNSYTSYEIETITNFVREIISGDYIGGNLNRDNYEDYVFDLTGVFDGSCPWIGAYNDDVALEIQKDPLAFFDALERAKDNYGTEFEISALMAINVYLKEILLNNKEEVLSFYKSLYEEKKCK